MGSVSEVSSRGSYLVSIRRRTIEVSYTFAWIEYLVSISAQNVPSLRRGAIECALQGVELSRAWVQYMSSKRRGTIEDVDRVHDLCKVWNHRGRGSGTWPLRGVEPSGIEYVFSIRRGTIEGVTWIEYMGSIRRGIIS